jgi:amidase
MDTFSAQEITELGRQFNIAVNETEADMLSQQVNRMLAELTDLDEFSTTSRAENTEERSWHEPDENPYNAIVSACRVPPTADHSGLLADKTVGVKDNIAVAGVPLTCASKVMEGFVPSVDATVVERLRAAGATTTAKVNLTEFAGELHEITPSTEPVINPYDEERIAGGSSGGSAVAVATESVDIGIGTDTGGSIRIPAAFCGVIGYKPTYGLVSLNGVVENTYTLDHVGPVTTTLDDAARTLEAIAGKDTRDPASLQAAGRDGYRVGGYRDAVANPPPLSDIRIGVLENGFGGDVADSVVERTRGVVDRFVDAGASTTSISIEGYNHGKTIKNTLSYTEMAAHWVSGGAAYRRGGVMDAGAQTEFAHRAKAASHKLNTPYKSKLLAGAYLIDQYGGRQYTRAQAAREVLTTEFEDALSKIDALLLPTMPDVPPRIADFPTSEVDYFRNTRPGNVTRLPAVTLPAGTIDGLPVGVQLMGRPFGDAELLGAAAAVNPHLGT